MVEKALRLAVALIVGVCFVTVLACHDDGYGPQSTNPSAGKSGETRSTSPQPTAADKLSDSDRQFIMKAAAGGKEEVELGRLAAARASNPDVKSFGSRMMQDHSKAGDELTQLASRLGVSTAGQEDPTQKEPYARLSKLKGAEFDRAYMTDMVKDHVEDVSEFERYSNTAENPDLKAWASKTLPTLREHLQSARSTAEKVRVPK